MPEVKKVTRLGITQFKALHASPRTTFSKARVFGVRATYKFKTKSLLISEI
jgi:hypothetical protein